jgi:hypothetical protein
MSVAQAIRRRQVRFQAWLQRGLQALDVRRCRACGCTDNDCRVCIARTGVPCHWVEADLCSACLEDAPGASQGPVRRVGGDWGV